MLVGARQSFQVFGQKKHGFLEIINLCHNLGIGFFIT